MPITAPYPADVGDPKVDGASVQNQATDTFAAAAASASDHDDLAARRRDARESENVGAVRHHKKDAAPGPFLDDRARTGG